MIKRYALPIIAIILMALYFIPMLIESKPSRTVIISRKEDVKEIKIKKGDNLIRLLRRNGSWRIAAPEDWPADSEKVEALLNALKETVLENAITDNKSRYNEFGINGNGDYLEISTKNGQSRRFLLGKRGPRYSLIYIRPDDEATVYLVNAKFADRLPSGKYAFRDRTILSLEPSTIEKVQWKYGDESYSYIKREKEWVRVDTEGRETPLADDAIKDYLEDISSIRASGFLDNDRLPESADHVGKIIIKADEEIVLNLYEDKKKKEYYLLRGDMPYRISKFLKDRLFKRI